MTESLDGFAVWEPRVRARDSDQQIEENIRAVIERGLPELFPPAGQALAIACNGPSLVETWDRLKEWNGPIWALNGAHDWLLARGIPVTASVIMDSVMHEESRGCTPRPGITYYVSSGAGPRVVDRVCALAGRGSIRIFHCGGGGAHTIDPSRFWVPNGSTVGVTSVVLAHGLGYRALHMFGFDASLKDGEYHPGEAAPSGITPCEILSHGRVFASLPGYAAQAAEMIAVMGHIPNLNLILHGDGLMQHHLPRAIENERVKNQL